MPNTIDALAGYLLRGADPIVKMRPVSPSNEEALPDGACRSVWASSDGVITYVDLSDFEVVDFPVFAGVNQICAKQIKVNAGTPAKLFAGY